LNVNNLQYINGPGTGTITGLTTINDGGSTVPQATIQTQSSSYARPGCSLNTTLQTTKSQNYNLTLSYNETITGTTLSTLSIPTPQSADGCITKLVQSVNISLNEIVINGCSCCVVNKTSSPVGIQNHTLERGPSSDSPS
jgi:UDP-glucose 6-dehydrogenase